MLFGPALQVQSSEFALKIVRGLIEIPLQDPDKLRTLAESFFEESRQRDLALETF